MPVQINNTSDLRKVLIETIEGVRSGTIPARDATAIASLSGKILQSSKLDFEVIKYHTSHNNDALPQPQPLQLVDGAVTNGRGKRNKSA